MKKIIKIISFVLLGIIVLLAGTASYIQFASMPTYTIKVPELTIIPDSARVAEGSRIALTVCAHCHRGADGKLSGDLFMNDPAFGKMWSANITQDPEAGIGKYTDGELVRLLRTGVKRNGEFAGPFMMFPLMSDEDIASVVSFLHSDAPQVQPSPNRQPPAQRSFLFNMFMKMIVKPIEYTGAPIVAPAPSDKIAYGRYLATGKWACFSCHSAAFETNNDLEPEKSVGYFGGGNPITDKENIPVQSANITPDPETGIGAWTEEQFGEAVRFGKRPDGRPLSHLMPPMSVLTDAEVSALWAYLQTIPPIRHAVTRGPVQD